MKTLLLTAAAIAILNTAAFANPLAGIHGNGLSRNGLLVNGIQTQGVRVNSPTQSAEAAQPVVDAVILPSGETVGLR